MSWTISESGSGDNILYSQAGTPSLDLRFASTKSLSDYVTGSNLVDFTRASSGTYVGSDGLIKTAVTNSVIWSQDFSQVAWTKAHLNVTATTTTAPDGTSTAHLIIDDNTASVEHFVRQIPTSGAGSFTVSVFVKQGIGSRDLRIRAGDSGGFIGQVFFNPRTGAFRDSNGPITFNKISLSDQWFRIYVSFASTSTNTQFALYYTEEGATSTIYDGDGTSGIYLWGAQLEQSDTVGEYVKTTSTINSAPRFDHDPTTGESLGLLVEEARTNGIRNNTMVGAVAGTPGTLPTNWSVFGPGLGTLTSQIVSIGTSGGVVYIEIKFSGTTGGTQASVAFEPTAQIVAATGQTWAASAWLSIVGGSFSNVSSITLDVAERTNVGEFVTLKAGANLVASLSSSLTRYSFAAALDGGATVERIQPRLVLTVASGAAIDITLRIGMPQLEKGSFATSVIPTEGSTVTRAADVASITGANFSSWINFNDGTFFSDSTVIAPDVQTQAAWSLTGGTYVTSLRQPQGAGDRFRAQISNVFTPAPGTGDLLSDGTTKACVAYSGTAGRLQVGSSGDDVAAAGILDATDLYIGSILGGTSLNGTIRRLVYWDQRLPNDTLQTITL